MHTLVRQFSDYIANVTTTNTDLVKELSRKIAECDELRSENDSLISKLFTLEKEAETLRMCHSNVKPGNTQQWQTQTKKRPNRNMMQSHTVTEPPAWKMVPAEVQHVPPPAVTVQQATGQMQPVTGQVQQVTGHMQQYQPQTCFQQMPVQYVPQQQQQLVHTAHYSPPVVGRPQAQGRTPRMKPLQARSPRHGTGSTMYTNSTVPVYQHSRPPNMMSAQPRCYKCGEAGHMKLQCRHNEPIVSNLWTAWP
jgi:hypothetical protein